MIRGGWWKLDNDDQVGIYLPGGWARATKSGDRTWLWNVLVVADDGTVLDRFGVTTLVRAKEWAERLTAQHAATATATTTATNPEQVAA